MVWAFRSGALGLCTVCAAGVTLLNVLDRDWIGVAIGVVLVVGLIVVIGVVRRPGAIVPRATATARTGALIGARSSMLQSRLGSLHVVR